MSRERPLRDTVFTENMNRRVLEFLETHQEFDYTPNEIRKGIGAKWTRTIKKSVNILVKQQKIVKARSIGKLYTYQTPEWVNSRLLPSPIPKLLEC